MCINCTAPVEEYMHEFGHQKQIRIAFVGGGSLNWAMGLIKDLAYDTRLAAEVRLFDLDFAAAQRNAEIGENHAEVSRGVPATYRAVPSLTEALVDADVVVISILPGPFDAMAHDIEIPAAYGIPQAVGDSVGPGGFVRAMRAIPMLAEIGAAIRAFAPKAYVCNLTNPMSVLTGALYRAFPGIRAWGECHEVTKIRRQVAWIANQSNPETPVDFRDVQVNVLGINHFTFVDQISVRGVDLMPAYRAFALQHAQAGWAQTEPGKDSEHARYFGSRNLVAFDLLKRFGIPAAAGDRHLAEFMPAADYLHNPERWGFALTPVDYRITDRAAKLDRAQDLRTGTAPPKAHRSDEAVIDQIAALMGGDPIITNVNLPNQGQITGLPDGAIVESNAVFSGLGVAPTISGRLPEPLERIVADHATRQTALLDAVMQGDTSELYPLFASDPLVAPLEEAKSREMFDRMVAATSSWLPDNLKGAA